MQRYSVVSIFRTNGPRSSFVISLMGKTKEYYRIDQSLSVRVSRGMVYIGDQIQIREMTADGIVFDVVGEGTGEMPEGDTDDPASVLYGPLPEIKPTVAPGTRLLPYLCDVLPYSVRAIPEVEAVPERESDGSPTGRYRVGTHLAWNIRLPVAGMFIGKIEQKTRINVYSGPFNPFFFVIIASGAMKVKVVCWVESLQTYSSLRVGDVIMVKDYRHKRKWAVIDKIDINTFTESVYFDVEEVTAKELVKIQFEGRIPPGMFEHIEGTVEYLSVLMRLACNESLMEYVLMRVGNKHVMLFYNSDSNFYRIKVGAQLSIRELRRMQRAGHEFYVSTIYTQFDLMEGEEGRHTGEVFGAMGFLPDSFKDMGEITDHFRKEFVSSTDERSREISINLFMRPIFTALSELPGQHLVLNETKKYIVNCKITKVGGEGCSVDYIENGENKIQGSVPVVLDGTFEVFIFDNFFTKESGVPSVEAAKAQIGKTQNVIVEAFRIDETNVLYTITGLVPEQGEPL